MLPEAIIKYINNELEISKYKIYSIRRLSDIKPSQKRILDIEEELCSIPFDKMNFEAVSDVAAAFRIFRESRSLFYKTYVNSNSFLKKDGESSRAAADICSSIESKFDFLNHKSNQMMYIRPQEINVIQDAKSREFFIETIANKLGTSIDKQQNNFKNKSFQETILLEPAKVARFRARKQACIFSAGKYIEDVCDKLMYEYSFLLSSNKYSALDLLKIESSVDDILLNLNKNIFRNYNYSLEKISSVIENTMGYNDSCKKIRPLRNCLISEGDFPSPISINEPRGSARVENLFYGKKRPFGHSFSRDKSNNLLTRVYGLLMPLKRIGNEKLTPLHIDIWTDLDICINTVLLNKISNTKAIAPNLSSEVYYKSIFLLPMWRVLEVSFVDDKICEFASRLIGTSLEDFKKIDFNNKNIVSKISCSSDNFVNINMDKSLVLAPSTRSEEEAISSMINDLKITIFELSGTQQYLDKHTINNQTSNE